MDAKTKYASHLATIKEHARFLARHIEAMEQAGAENWTDVAEAERLSSNLNDALEHIPWCEVCQRPMPLGFRSDICPECEADFDRMDAEMANAG